MRIEIQDFASDTDPHIQCYAGELKKKPPGDLLKKEVTVK